MLYYSDADLTVRDMVESDARRLYDAELAQGWHPDMAGYLKRLEDQRTGRSIALTAECGGEVAGKLFLYPDSPWGAFGGRGLPEIVDLCVFERFQRRGIGSRLMDVAEALAARHADMLYLAVGLHGGYGSAQRMYARRGYVPDGSGAWYGDAVCPQYAPCANDDDLVLYLSKKLKGV